VWSAATAGIAAVVALPVAVGGAVLLAIGSGVIAGGGCGGDGGPGGGSQQLGGRVWSAEQMNNTHTITQVTQSRQLPRRAAVLAVTTAIVESQLANVHYGDRDSLGLFQQRPSQGWGGPADILNPAAATGKFLDHLVAVPRWPYLVSARNSAALRDLRIFVDHSVEPVTPNDLGLGYVGLGECS
jgi:hypothetical protein